MARSPRGAAAKAFCRASGGGNGNREAVGLHVVNPTKNPTVNPQLEVVQRFIDLPQYQRNGAFFQLKPCFPSTYLAFDLPGRVIQLRLPIPRPRTYDDAGKKSVIDFTLYLHISCANK